VFVDAREVRAIVLPDVVRLLGEAAGARVGVAVVEGKVLAAFDVAAGPGPSPGAALVVASEGRGEAFVALGLEIVEAGSFDAGADADVVAIDGQPVPVVSLVAAFRSIDAAAWAAHGAVGLGAVGLADGGLGTVVDASRGGTP
jgi:hypothetical protein